MTNNSDAGIGITSSSNNEFYLNDIINNSPNVRIGGSIDYFIGTGIGKTCANICDNGQVGNYWSEHNVADANHDSIGDTRYVIDTNNIDTYPLKAFFKITPSPLQAESSPTSSSSSYQLAQRPFQKLLAVAAIGVSPALLGVLLLRNYRKRPNQQVQS